MFRNSFCDKCFKSWFSIPTLVGHENYRELEPVFLCFSQLSDVAANFIFIFTNNSWGLCCDFFMWQEWTEAPSMPGALVSLLLRLPNLKFIIVTLGENGCIMLERSLNGEYSITQFFLWGGGSPVKLVLEHVA